MKNTRMHIGRAAVAFVVLAMLMGYTTSQLTIYGTSVQNPVDVNATNIIDAPLIQQGGRTLNQTIADLDVDTTYTAGNGVTLVGAEFSAGTNTMLNTTDWPTCGAGDFTTNDGSVFTCATPADTTYTAGNGVTLVGTEFSAGTATTLNLTDLPTCGAGDFTTSDGSVFTCDTPAGGGAGQPNIDTANITTNTGVIPVAITVTDSVTVGNSVIESNEITITGDYVIDPSGNNVNPGSNDVDQLGISGTQWNTIWTSKVESSADIVLNAVGKDVKPPADNDVDLGQSNLRWRDTQSVLFNGADICFQTIPKICMTECIQDGLQDICYVVGGPTGAQLDKIGIATITSYAEYLSRKTNGDKISEAEFEAIHAEVYTDGKVDFTFGRTIKMSIREVKEGLERLDEIEATLCNNGVQKYC